MKTTLLALSCAALTFSGSAFAKSVRVAPFALFDRPQSPSVKLATSRNLAFEAGSILVTPKNKADGFGTNLLVASKGKTGKVLFGSAVGVQVAFAAQSLAAVRGVSTAAVREEALDIGGQRGSALEAAHPGRVWTLALDGQGAPLGAPVFLGKKTSSSKTKLARVVRTAAQNVRAVR